MISGPMGTTKKRKKKQTARKSCYSVADQRSGVFGHFLMIYDESRCQIWARAILGLLKRINGPDFSKRPRIIPEIMIQWFGNFYKYHKISDESKADIWIPSRFEHFKHDYRFRF